MRIGICAAIDNLRDVTAMGYDYLESEASRIAAMTEAEFARTAEQVRSASIPCDCFNVLFPQEMTLIGPESSSRPEQEAYLRHTFTRLRELGGKLVVFGSGKARRRPDNMDFGSAYRQLVEITRFIGETAGEYGLTVAVEPLNRGECNLICSVGEGAMLAADVSLPNVKPLADLYHMQLENEAIENISRVGSLVHVHIAARQGRKYPLTAAEPFRKLFEQLYRIDYPGRISVEGRTTDFKRDAPAALAVLRKLDLESDSKP